MKTYLLDTNIISDVLRKKRLEVSKRLESAIADNAVIILSPVVYFEIMRGLLHANAERQMLFFMALMMEFRWTDLERADWDRAASLWVELTKQGRTPEDADILIAAQAIGLGATVVTSNVKHFDRLPVTVENWRE